MDDFKEYPNTEYGDGVKVDEYKGALSLVSARRGKDGEVFMDWVFPQKRDGSKEPIDKCLPWKVKLGDTPQKALEMLTFAAKIVKSHIKEEEVPF